MQFPYPRKTSNPSAFQSTRASSYQQRRNFRRLAAYALAALTTIFFLLWLFSGSSSRPRIPAGTPEVVIVTTLDPHLSQSYKSSIKENRRDYASRHGYATFFPNTTDYDLMPHSPSSWSTVPAMRHAMTLYPHTPWLWYLTSTALIMSTRQDLHSTILDPRKLEQQMLVDKPVEATTAVETSLRVTRRNPLTVAIWGFYIAALLAIACIPAFVGLAIALPVLGYASWHLYDRAVER